MTREEAIDRITMMQSTCGVEGQFTALDMALDALQFMDSISETVKVHREFEFKMDGVTYQVKEVLR